MPATVAPLPDESSTSGAAGDGDFDPFLVLEGSPDGRSSPQRQPYNQAKFINKTLSKPYAMVREGDTAPDFTAPLATGEVGEFTLSEELSKGPAILAFFPGAFTRVCSHELQAFQERIESFNEMGAQLYGVSIDTPFSLNAFKDELGLTFSLISDPNREIVEKYDVSTSLQDFGIDNLANRAVFVIDESQQITYAWIADDPGNEPDYEEVTDAIEAVTEEK